MRIGCIVLASGQGRRFGSNKLLADLCGKPVLAHTLCCLPLHRLERTVVVTRWPEVQQLCREMELSVLLHDKTDRSDVVRLGMEQMNGLDGCMFYQGDQPLCRPVSLERLLDSFCAAPQKIHRLSRQGEAASPVIFSARFFEELRHLPQGKGGGAVIHSHPSDVLCTEAADPCELWDIDTPQMLAKIEQHLKNSAFS